MHLSWWHEGVVTSPEVPSKEWFNCWQYPYQGLSWSTPVWTQFSPHSPAAATPWSREGAPLTHQTANVSYGVFLPITPTSSCKIVSHISTEDSSDKPFSYFTQVNTSEGIKLFLTLSSNRKKNNKLWTMSAIASYCNVTSGWKYQALSCSLWTHRGAKSWILALGPCQPDYITS